MACNVSRSSSLTILLSPSGLVNDLLAAHPNNCIPQVVCQFLNGPIAFEICFSTNPTTYTNLTNTDSANGANFTNVTIPIPLSIKLQTGTLYYFDVFADGDSMWIQTQGNFTTGMFVTFLNGYSGAIAGYMHVCTCKRSCECKLGHNSYHCNQDTALQR